jgi:molecular chaperone DnaJ
MVAQREWFEKDYYQVLGVAATATDKEITRAYRKLAKQYHPDANPGSEDRFKDISAAYDVLGDETKRKEYDEVRRLGPMAAGFGGGGGGPQGFRMEDMGDLGDIFGDLFGGRGGRGARRSRGAQRGADMESALHLSFRDAIHGVTTSVHVPEDGRCNTCNGSGAAEGSKTNTCSRCAGRGTLDDNQGLFSLSTVCPNCQGRGVTIETPCTTCRGSGTVRRSRGVKVRIPAGVEDGQRIRIKGRGAPGKANGPAGDLYVVVSVAHDPVFSRKGKNITTAVTVSYPDVVLGTNITVDTLDDPVTLRVPPGTTPGTQLRVKGRGVPSGDAGHAPGDLLVRVNVSVPSELTDAQRKAVEKLRDLFESEKQSSEVPS